MNSDSRTTKDLPAWTSGGVVISTVAMAVVVTVSNILVNIPLNDWLTWGAFTYPIAFLITDLTNRQLGANAARRLVYVGFALAVLLSLGIALFTDLSSVRIALASGTAFLCAQYLDVQVFDRLRAARAWWHPPLVSSVLGSAVDTGLFFSLAFAFDKNVPFWPTLALGDLGVKLATALVLLVPFALFAHLAPARASA